MIGEAPGSGQDKSRIFEIIGGAWTNSYSHGVSEVYRRGVDIDDGVYMFTRGDGSFNYFDFYDAPDGRQVLKAHVSNSVNHSFASVALHKEQIIGNRPDTNEAVTLGVPCGIKPLHLKAKVWEIVSLSCAGGTKTPQTVFGDELGTNYGDNGDWVMYRQIAGNYTGKQIGYEIVPIGDTLELGKSYWIASKTDKTVKDDDTSATYTTLYFTDTSATRPAEVADYYEIPVPSASSASDTKKVMVGNPLARTIHWQYVQSNDNGLLGREALSNASSFIDKTAFVYDETGSSQPYRAVPTSGTLGFDDIIKPYQGFWIKRTTVAGPGGVTLSVPFEK